MTINDLQRMLNDLSDNISIILNCCNYEYASSLDEDKVKFDRTNPNDLLLKNEFEIILNSLQEINWKMEYLKRKVVWEGIMHRNRNDRYECDLKEYTCGNSIEFLYYNKWNDCHEWITSNVEHDGNDYYIVGYKHISLEGLRVRIRE